MLPKALFEQRISVKREAQCNMLGEKQEGFGRHVSYENLKEKKKNRFHKLKY